MKISHVLLWSGAVAVALYAAAEALSPASPVQRNRTVGASFPEVNGSNLEGKRYYLPRDFEGETNLCLIAFTQKQQFEVNTWLAGVKPLENTPGFQVYELPTISTGTAPFRLWLDSVMHQGIPDRRQREHTITLYLDKVKFREQLDLPHEETIYALLVDRDGHILWRATGVWTADTERDLKAALEFTRSG